MSQAAATLREALNGVVLSQSQAVEVFAAITNGEFNEIEIAAFLGALHAVRTRLKLPPPPRLSAPPP